MADELKTRIVVPPMSDFGTVAPDGLVHQSHIDRYEAYAKGGAGLIIIEACSVLKMPENRDTLCLENDNCIPGIKMHCRYHSSLFCRYISADYAYRT